MGVPNAAIGTFVFLGLCVTSLLYGATRSYALLLVLQVAGAFSSVLSIYLAFASFVILRITCVVCAGIYLVSFALLWISTQVVP